MAETYGIFEYRQLPAYKVAVFSFGLREDSRIIMKLANRKVDVKTELLAGLFDIQHVLLWSKTNDGQKGYNKPISISESLSGKQQPKEEITSFESGKDFMEIRKKYVKERRE